MWERSRIAVVLVTWGLASFIVLAFVGVCLGTEAFSQPSYKVGSVEETLNVLDYTAIQIYSNSNCTAKYAYTRAGELLEEKKLHASK